MTEGSQAETATTKAEAAAATAPASTPLVAIRGLHKTFLHMGRKLDVLQGIDLDIGAGEIVAIVGKSGAGKSTLLHCIGTLDLPSRGSIRLGNQELTGLPSTRLADIRNRTIGFVFQFHHLLPEFSALENVMMPGLIQGRKRSELTTRARTLLDEVGLRERETHRPGELSGGEQQRVALARALVLEPKLILADEPTGNLDTATSDAIHQLFFEISRRHGTTIIVVTHNVAFAQSMPRMVTMRDGRILRDELRGRDYGPGIDQEPQSASEAGLIAPSSDAGKDVPDGSPSPESAPVQATAASTPLASSIAGSPLASSIAETAVEPARPSMRGIGNILFGVVFLIGGASGSLVLRGTNSSIALVLVGVLLIALGIVRSLPSRQ
jgi:lipoprotein-releasing system ATP-binding protein